jgi:hypothetical protein
MQRDLDRIQANLDELSISSCTAVELMKSILRSNEHRERVREPLGVCGLAQLMSHTHLSEDTSTTVDCCRTWLRQVFKQTLHTFNAFY